MPKLLTDRQLDVMEILWEESSATVREVKSRIRDDLAYTSVLTLLQTLEENSYVDHTEEGKAYRYWPNVSRAQAARDYASFLKRHGLLDPMLEEVDREEAAA